MSVAPVILTVSLKANPDGSLRTTNPSGDFNPAPTTLAIDKAAFSAALGSLIGLITGATAINFNARGAWLTGTDAAACTFALVTISGSSASAKNWSFSGSTLQQSLVSGSIGAGTFEIDAIDLGGHVLSLGQFTWSIAAASGGTDTLAPTIPTGLVITGGTGALNCQLDAASDRYDGATQPSGLDHYEVYLDGAFNKNVAATKNPSVQMVATNIGSIASPGAPTSSQSAGVWTLTAAGVGIHNTPTEECLFLGAPLAGDFSITVRADAFTSANEFSTSGIMIRETLSQGAIFGALYVQPSATAHGLQVKGRVNTGGKGLNVAAVSAITSSLIRLTRSGNNVIASYTIDGNQWLDIATLALPMASQVYVGLFLASQTAGVNCTSTIREVNINTVPKVSFSVTTSGTHTLTVRSADLAGNVSAFGAGVTGTAVAVTRSGTLKQHGGAALYLDRNTNTSAKLARMQTFADVHSSNRGVQDIVFMAKIENPNVPGDYSGGWDASGDSGWNYFDKMLKQCHDVRPADPLYYQFQISPYGFGGNNKSSTVWPGGFAPHYLSGAQYGPSNAVETTGEWGGVWINTVTMTSTKGATVGYFLRWWVPAVMDRIIAWMNAFGARYDNINPALNAPNSNLFYRVSPLSETTTPLYTSYTDDAAIAQYKRIAPAGRAAIPTGRLRMWGNYLQDNSRCKEVLDIFAPYWWDWGGADCINETGTHPRVIPFDQAFRGVNPATKLRDPTYQNYVGRLGWVAEFEPDEQGPRGPKTGTNDWTGPATLGSNNWTDYFQHANDQGAGECTMFDNNYTGNNDKRFGGFVASQPTHPNAQDFLISVGTDGSNVNGATAGLTLLNKDVYPSDYPT